MGIYSFRAECQADVEQLSANCKAVGITWTSLRVIPDKGFPDVEVELETTATLDELLNAVRAVQDGHVVLQTLRAVPLAQNSLIRDTDIE